MIIKDDMKLAIVMQQIPTPVTCNLRTSFNYPKVQFRSYDTKFQ